MIERSPKILFVWGFLSWFFSSDLRKRIKGSNFSNIACKCWPVGNLEMRRRTRDVEKLMGKYPPAEARRQKRRQNLLPTSSLHWPYTRYKIFHLPIMGSERHIDKSEKYNLNIIFHLIESNANATCIFIKSSFQTSIAAYF